MQMPILEPIPILTKNKNFLNKIRIWLFENRKYKIAKEWEYRYNQDIVFIIPAGFIFDGASVPRLFWPILSPTGLLLIQGLLLHQLIF